MKLPFPVIGQSIERNVYALRETLFRVFEELYLPHYVAGGAWEYLQARYTEPGRHYHTLGHLVDMFNAAANLGVDLSPEETLAILYHDVIYETGANDNEERSARVLTDLRWALACVDQFVVPHDGGAAGMAQARILDGAACATQASILDTAAQIIRDTARYLDDGRLTECAHSHLVMDLDLSSFAKPYELFCMTNQLVREEVGIDHKTHAGFLAQFLERDLIYRTVAAWDAWEAQARENIQRYVGDAGNEA